jgi:hypothetical protein
MCGFFAVCRSVANSIRSARSDNLTVWRKYRILSHRHLDGFTVEEYKIACRNPPARRFSVSRYKTVSLLTSEILLLHLAVPLFY